MLFQQPIPDAEQADNAEQQQQYVDGLGETRRKDIAGCFEKSIPELAKTAYEANTKRFRVCPSIGKAVVLAGIAMGSIWSAGTTILQFFATDVGLSASVVWSFGDLSRATYKTDIIMGIVVLIGFVFFYLCSWRFNVMLSGDDAATGSGVNVKALRFLSLLVASMLTAVCVSFLGIIGFVGIICPHVMKRIIGYDHKYLIPSSCICGSLLLLIADTLSKALGNGTALPVGAITSIIGAPFFLYIIFSKRE